MTVRDPFKNPLIPDSSDLLEIFGEAVGEEVLKATQLHLLEPVREMMARPSKNFRAELVRIGFDLASLSETGSNKDLDEDRLRICSEIIELLHAGSLIVDDIEDQSEMRRGRPTLHQLYPLSVALNSGNWLYFWPLHRLQRLGLEPERELFLHRIAHETLMKAHFGQALDLGSPVDQLPQHQIHEVCRSSMTLKSGALMSLSLALGAVLGGMQEPILGEVLKLGVHIGTALQMFDDVGNLTLERDGKRLEDLKNRRPSWVWAVAAQESPEVFGVFVKSVQQLPDETQLKAWLAESQLPDRARSQAREYMKQSQERFYQAAAGEVNEAAWHRLTQMMERVMHAYG